MAVRTAAPEYTIRLMKEHEIPEVLDLWKETGLSEGTHSVHTWYRYDPHGFFVAAADSGEILGICAGVLQNVELAFVGMYAVKKEYRRQGIGTRLWQATMDRIGDRNAGVNPVPNQLSNYRDRAGFGVQTSWKSVVCVSREIKTEDIVKDIPGHSVRRLTLNDPRMHDVSDYDATVYGFNREPMLELLATENESVTMFATDDSHHICGYGSIKASIKGNALVGPLYADDSRVAELLLWYLVQEFPLAQRNGLTLMIIDANGEALALADKIGLKKQSGIARLYRKAEVDADISKVFGQHNLNFSVF